MELRGPRTYSVIHTDKIRACPRHALIFCAANEKVSAHCGDSSLGPMGPLLFRLLLSGFLSGLLFHRHCAPPGTFSLVSKVSNLGPLICIAIPIHGMGAFAGTRFCGELRDVSIAKFVPASNARHPTAGALCHSSIHRGSVGFRKFGSSHRTLHPSHFTLLAFRWVLEYGVS